MNQGRIEEKPERCCRKEEGGETLVLYQDTESPGDEGRLLRGMFIHVHV